MTRDTTPASSSSFKWREIVGFETPRSWLASPTVAAPALSRSTMPRRMGWARAVNASLAISLTILSTVRRREQWRRRRNAGAQGRNARGVAGRARRATGRRKGAHPPQRRAGGAPPGAAVGADRKGLQLRDRGRHEVPRRPVRRALAAADLPLHVWPEVRDRLHRLLVDRRHAQPAGAPSRGARRDDDLRFARATRQAARLQGADGLELRLGLVGRQRLQLRFRPLAHRGGCAAVP